jgi:hypothetical protein
MKSKRNLVRIFGLLAGSIADCSGLPFSSSFSMLIEELVGLAEESNNELSAIKSKIDSIIIADFSTAIEYLNQAQDDHGQLSEFRKTSALEKANELFMKSYFRLLDDRGLKEYSALSAVYVGIIHAVLNEKRFAIKWFSNAKNAYQSYYEMRFGVPKYNTVENRKPRIDYIPSKNFYSILSIPVTAYKEYMEYRKLSREYTNSINVNSNIVELHILTKEEIIEYIETINHMIEILQ